MSYLSLFVLADFLDLFSKSLCISTRNTVIYTCQLFPGEKTMSYRKKMSRSGSKRSFRSNSSSKKINHPRPGMRGGIRL